MSVQPFILRRVAHTDLSTRGELFAPDGTTKLCEMLERGTANPDGHPRIPAGTYGLTLHSPSEFDNELGAALGTQYHGVLRLLNVPGRSAIEIHPANKISELKGCCAPGKTWHTDTSGEFTVWNSVDACKTVYPLITQAILSNGAQIALEDELV